MHETKDELKHIWHVAKGWLGRFELGNSKNIIVRKVECEICDKKAIQIWQLTGYIDEKGKAI